MRKVLNGLLFGSHLDREAGDLEFYGRPREPCVGDADGSIGGQDYIIGGERSMLEAIGRERVDDAGGLLGDGGGFVMGEAVAGCHEVAHGCALYPLASDEEERG